MYTIRVDATEDDLLQRGQACAELTKEVEKLEADKKESMRAFKEDIDLANSKISEMAREIREKKVTVRNATCTEVIYPDEKMYRKYWGEIIIEERKMTESEIEKFCSGIFATPENKENFDRGYEARDDIKDVIKLESHVKTKKSHV